MTNYEKEARKGPDSWKPGVFGMYNDKATRIEKQKDWEEEAKQQKKNRSLGDKILRQSRVSAKRVMLDEAHVKNALFDAAQKDPSRVGVPDVLYHQKLEEGILAESGINPHIKYSNAGDLEEDLKKSDVPYKDRVHTAAAKLRPELGKDDERIAA